MARPEKNTVDYFPHYVYSGKTLFTVEQRFGNDGYAFLFKILEVLGKTENHFIDCRKPEDYEYLLAITKVSRDKAEEIMALLTTLGTFDADLWKHRIIYSDNFIKNLEGVYERRKRKTLTKQDLCKQLSIKCKQKPASRSLPSAETPQSKVKESKEKKSEGEKSIGDSDGISDEIPPSQEARGYFEKILGMNLPEGDMERQFAEYWTEKNKNGNKQRWELEKTFEVKKRLATWRRKTEEYNSKFYGKNQRDNHRDGQVSTEGHADLVV
ncbi:DUF4373 domain-containing protein [Candidatus Uhrbacteria bacterium]|nr:DUF4373 domain-containing protein [Candidatus Uhrbacteria bacterium]